MKSHHFSFGNSSEGPIGFCARITAETPERAAEILKAHLVEEVEIKPIVSEGEELKLAEGEEVEYIRAYVNPAMVTPESIDSIDEE